MRKNPKLPYALKITDVKLLAPIPNPELICLHSTMLNTIRGIAVPKDLPVMIILGGGVSNVDFLYTEGAMRMHKLGLSNVKTPILKNKLGDSAGVYGACMLACRKSTL